nr:hypothetical protein BaRGS_003154 [Batillaria attramentaria]
MMMEMRMMIRGTPPLTKREQDGRTANICRLTITSFSLKQEPECNLEVECLEAEDEVDCPYSSDACGPGQIEAGDKCYTYEYVRNWTSPTCVDMSHTSVETYDGEMLRNFPGLKTLNISYGALRAIADTGFKTTPSLEILDMRGDTVNDFPDDLLQHLKWLKTVYATVGQLLIYMSVQKNSIMSDQKSAKDTAIARRLTTIVLSDFLCWFPIGLLGLLASTGTPISGEVNVAIAIFVLPLNSAVNPFLYTLNIVLEKRRKAYEARLLEQLVRH